MDSELIRNMIISKRAPPKSQNKMDQEVGQEKYEIVCGALKKGCDYEKTSELALSSKKSSKDMDTFRIPELRIAQPPNVE